MLKVDWEDRLCPGGCGHLHRRCCDSVIGSDHQSSCEETAERMREIRERFSGPTSGVEAGPDPSPSGA